LNFAINVAGWVVLAALGGHARLTFEQRGHVLDMHFFRERSILSWVR
jgi:hypothetical protein